MGKVDVGLLRSLQLEEYWNEHHVICHTTGSTGYTPYSIYDRASLTFSV
jgi:hypothetical protein